MEQRQILPKIGHLLETQKRDLPPRLHYKDGGYYYVHKNRWNYVSDSKATALRRYVNELADSEELRRAAAAIMSTPKEMAKYLPQVYQRSKRNALARKIGWAFTRAEFDAIAKRANGRCEVSGLEFDLQLRPYSFRRPFAPSLDRINPSETYTAGNCRLVCCIVNAAMSDWGEQPFALAAAAMAAKAGWKHT